MSCEVYDTFSEFNERMWVVPIVLPDVDISISRVGKSVASYGTCIVLQAIDAACSTPVNASSGCCDLDASMNFHNIELKIYFFTMLSFSSPATYAASIFCL